MTGYTAPPQAYTRDTLVKAIDWIAHQPESLRKQATNADSLVALYLRTKRRNGGASASQTYPSGESFAEDLKSLAKDLDLFAGPSATQSAPRVPPQVTPPPQMPPQVNFQMNFHRGEPVSEPIPQAPKTTGPTWAVDAKSWAQAQAIKERLNLSSEGEALRMMIAMGAERLSSLLP